MKACTFTLSYMQKVMPTPFARLYTCRAKVDDVPVYFIFSMLETIAVVLLVLWVLGMVSSYTLGGFINILLVLAIVVILIRVIQGRNPF